MHGSSLKRAERLSQASGLLWAIIILACASALLVPLLVLGLGLVLQYLVTPDSHGPAREFVLGPYAGWPFRGVLDRSGSSYLLILLSIGALLALLNTAALLVFQRLLHKYALQVSVALRRAIHDQAFVLGPHELLTPVRSRRKSCSWNAWRQCGAGWCDGGTPCHAALSRSSYCCCWP